MYGPAQYEKSNPKAVDIVMHDAIDPLLFLLVNSTTQLMPDVKAPPIAKPVMNLEIQNSSTLLANAIVMYDTTYGNPNKTMVFFFPKFFAGYANRNGPNKPPRVIMEEIHETSSTVNVLSIGLVVALRSFGIVDEVHETEQPPIQNSIKAAK